MMSSLGDIKSKGVVQLVVLTAHRLLQKGKTMVFALYSV